MNNTFVQTTQFTVPVSNTTGSLMGITSSLQDNGINIIGLTAETLGDVSFVRFTVLPDQIGLVEKALTLPLFKSPLLTVYLPNKVGELSKLTKHLKQNEINIKNIYVTTLGNTDTVAVNIGVDLPFPTPTSIPQNIVDVFQKFFGTVAVA